MEIRGLGMQLADKRNVRELRGSGFVEELRKMVEWVNSEQKKAEKIKEMVLMGKEIPLHEMLIQMEKAKTALNLLIQVRNKLVEAFQELNRMQV